MSVLLVIAPPPASDRAWISHHGKAVMRNPSAPQGVEAQPQRYGLRPVACDAPPAWCPAFSRAPAEPDASCPVAKGCPDLW